MIYLVSQMLVALSLAVLMGGAIGWLIHRATHTARVDELHHGLVRQQAQLNQAQSEVAMLSDDYDEMHRRTQEEIEALRQENQQIPFLNTNLEKSQLLVRQMMQRHEAKVRDLTGEKEKLTSRLKTIEDRDQAYNKVQAELDSRRRENNRQTDSGTAVSMGASAAAQDQATHEDSSSAQAISTDTKAEQKSDSPAHSNAEADLSTLSDQLVNAKSNSSWASAPLALNALMDVDSSKSITIDADADPFDNVMEVGDELQRELDSTAPADTTLDNVADTYALDPAPEINTVENGSGTGNNPSHLSADSRTVNSASMSSEQLDFELSGTSDTLHDDFLLDGSSDASDLFEPVEQRDDLKQIFGIGPVTEKALNDMGITSYSQLADLKHHQIQTIADALQIVPGRIERDDWMGNARRQLEEVLEQL